LIDEYDKPVIDYLDNIPSIQSSWVTQGLDIGQIALKLGANDLGSIMIEENVVSQAGTTFRMTVADMKRLISDLLNYSRTNKEWLIEQVDISETIQEALKNLRASINECGAIIEFENMPTLRVDRSQMLQLFQNLIGNAIKFRKEGGQPFIKITAAKQDTEWLFSVEDNGIGIDQQYSEKVFVIFRKLHNQTKFEGTGIGLSIAKKIVERHGGRIWFESEPGKGTKFYFTLQSVNNETDQYTSRGR